MTVKTMANNSSEITMTSLREKSHRLDDSRGTISDAVLKAWTSLPENVKSALISSEISKRATATSTVTSKVRSCRDSQPFGCLCNDSPNETNALSSDDDDEFRKNVDECTGSPSKIVLKPLEGAPKNVFALNKTQTEEYTDVKIIGGQTVKKTKNIISTVRGWRNVFTLPISYDVNLVSHGTILDPTNMQLFNATGVHPEGYNRRFAVIDVEVDKIYGIAIRKYFVSKGIQLTTCILNGGEDEKRPAAVDKVLDDLCAYKLRRREPFLAIGGGVLLDIAGMAACTYRRGVPFVRVPTTLLAIVDASVGVKNGCDYFCGITGETYKNRVGSFYAPSSCLLDNSFITTQDERNICNGFGEIMKLALVRSKDLFQLLESHGAALIKSRFQSSASVPEGVSDRIIELSIQIMLEELGPNLWEFKLDRCVDYGHTFSKLLEMVPGADIMHGEAVNVDGFFCIVISHLRGYIDMVTMNQVFRCMKLLSLPTNSMNLTHELAWESCKDAIEHRHGKQRIPLITEIGKSICVNDITPEELDRAVKFMKEFDH